MNNDNLRKKSILELYGLSKYNIEKKYFEKILLEENNTSEQINSYINLLESTKIKINNFYDYLISFFIILIFSIIYFTQYIFNFFEKTKEEWDNYKCDPRVIGYGGYIQKNPGRTEFESTEDNFWDCIEPTIRRRYELSFSPLYDLVSGAASTASDVTENTSDVASTGVVNTENDTTTNTSLNDLTNNTSELNLNVSSDSNLTSSEIFTSLGVVENDIQKNNSQMNKKTKIFNKLLNLLSLIFNVLNISILGLGKTLESGLVFIYQFFEGMLIILAILIIGFMIIGGSIMAVCISLGVTSVALMVAVLTAPAGVAIASYVPALLVIAFVFFAISLAFLIIFLIVVITMLLYKEFLEGVFNINLVGRKTETPPKAY